jgi:hypothetical protein
MPVDARPGYTRGSADLVDADRVETPGSKQFDRSMQDLVFPPE